LTVPHAHFQSFPAYFPVIALDKAFSRGPIEVRHARVVHTSLARRASDHLPLVLDFHLSPG
jgi:endonuclease/exonuclease/phosphatase family metal-dependent hydrolase